jgi:prepilin-type N-terminal cleavage/methylation domain-containing protein
MKSRGFTLIEIVIAIFIMSIAVVGVFSAYSMMVILTSDSADRLTASYLAQEGIEVIRNIRDKNWLNMFCCTNGGAGCPADSCDPAPAWLDGLMSDSVSTKNCIVDYKTTASKAVPVPSWSDGEPDYLYIDSAGFYSLSTEGETKTKFKRKIILEKKPIDSLNNYALKVTVEVSWNQKLTLLGDGEQAGTCNEGRNCIKAVETLYNWY